MDQCCSNVENTFALCLQSVTCRNLPCTVLKVFACLKLKQSSVSELSCPWKPRHRWEDNIRMDLK